MHSLWPTEADHVASSPVTDAELERIYAYPEPLSAPWVQVNFVASADGAVTVAGKSEGLSHPADKRVFALARDLADVVLVGAGTAATERYRGVRPNEVRGERRRRLGLAEVPPIAVVSARCNIPADAPVFTDTVVPPIVFTAEAAPPARRHAIEDTGAEVLVLGDDRVHLPAALHELDRRGLRRVNCEGGPHLFASLIADDLVDQLCLTVAPLLAGAGAGRVVCGVRTDEVRGLALVSVLHEDGFLLLRYRRRAAGSEG